MSFFDRNIDAVETAAHLVFWGGLAILALMVLTGPANPLSLVVLAVLLGAGLVLREAADAQERMDREAVERGTPWHRRLRANRFTPRPSDRGGNASVDGAGAQTT